MREHFDGAVGHHRKNSAADGDIEPGLLHRIADHDAAFVSLTDRVHHVIHEGRDLLGDDDLAALRTHWRTNSDHRSQPRIAKSSGEHDFVRGNFDVTAAQPELAATRLDPFHCTVGKISAAMQLKSDVQRAKQAQGIHMTVERTEARILNGNADNELERWYSSQNQPALVEADLLGVA